MSNSQLESACRTLRGLSDEVALWMLRQPNVGEETLTDFILYQSSVRDPWVRYRKFTRHQEARISGADFDWWFVGRSLSLGLRLQAKKVDAKGDHYPGLAHANKHGLQIAKLRESSRQDNLIPLYALYYSGIPPVDKVRCKSMAGSPTVEGLYVSGASRVYDRFIAPGPNRVTAEALLGESNPLRCLVCCSLLSGPGGPLRGFARHLGEYFPESLASDAPNRADATPGPGFHSNPPSHVFAMLELPPDEAPEWWDTEFSSLSERTNAVMVWDLRGAEET